MNNIESCIFGKLVGLRYSIDFLKRGASHAHNGVMDLVGQLMILRAV